MDIQKMLKQQDTTIKTKTLQIEKNVMRWDNAIIQLSNVSTIEAVNLAETPFPIWSLILVIAGLVMLFSGASLIPFGMIVLLCGAAWAFRWSSENGERHKMRLLILRMNSGQLLEFVFASKEFLEQVLDVLEGIIRNSHEAKSIVIDIKNSTIIDTSISAEAR